MLMTEKGEPEDKKVGFKERIYTLLKKDSRLWNEETKEFNDILLKDLIDKLDENILNLLLKNKEMKDKFFVKINDIFVLKQNELKFFIDENKLDNSYTQYRNQIGLRAGNTLLSERNETVLDWPFKDCVLEGGMTKEEEKDRKEVFFNEILAKDEIDRLFEPKVLINWKRYTANGEEKVKGFKRDADSTFRENLIIKGNNLIALHSLKELFNRKIKLIYIDVPFNTGNDSFRYNDRFNHSTWLTFMKNRLEIAFSLLKEEGIIFVHIDAREQAYLKVLMDNIFSRDNFLSNITLKSKAGGGVGQESFLFDVCEYILVYAKNKNLAKNNIKFIKTILNDKTKKVYNLILNNLGHEKHVSDIDGGNVGKIRVYTHEDYSVTKLPEQERTENNYYGYFEKIFRTTNPQGGLMQRVMPQISSKGLVSIEYIPTKGRSAGKKYRYYFLDGSLIVWLKDSAIKNEEEKRVYKLVKNDNLWIENLHQGIAKEGGVELKAGKKPEKLLKKIIEIATMPGDIILDYHIGCGTTCAVAHKLNRQYIGIEQLDYGKNDSLIRLKNVTKGDTTGISKEVNWKGGGNFIYLELAKWNEEAKERIFKAKNLKELEKLFVELCEQYFLDYNVKVKVFKEKTLKEENFKQLGLDKQKELFVEMLDMNQMYVSFSERNDKKYHFSKEDIALSEEFYKSKR
ncbi:MAG: site-specific DNA-methyltransferase [Candidatus Nanoarchaeia archaeon]|nr:site-specific DNA-methyltransferase [Candidatus Nanoarchaeia archaeon]